MPITNLRPGDNSIGATTELYGVYMYKMQHHVQTYYCALYCAGDNDPPRNTLR